MNIHTWSLKRWNSQTTSLINNMENITPKEIIIGIVVGLIILAVSILINPWAMSFIQKDIRDRERALQIDNNPEQFTYAKETSVGNVMAYGPMVALNSQSIPELTGQFSIVQEVTEQYTRHSQMVCKGYDEDGNCTGWHEQITYSWDYQRSQSWQSSEYDFLGVNFQAGLLRLPNLIRVSLNSETVSAGYINRVDYGYIYESDWIWSSVGDLRYSYYALPLEYNATLYVGFFLENVSPASVYYEQHPADMLEALKRREVFFNIAYYALILLITEGIYLWLAYEVIEVE